MRRPPRTVMIPLAAEQSPGNPELGRTLSKVLLAGGIVVMALCFFAILALAGLETGPVVLPLAILMAVAPVPVYAALALWLDRFEPEPVKLLVLVFAWGATIAAFAAFVLNTAGSLFVEGTLGTDAAEVYGGSISAPVIEESAKGAILVGLLIWRRDEINGVIDGVIYAAMVGLGFAMTENILYYGRGAVEEGVEGAVGTFIVRGLMSPFAHPVFTAATGIGIGLSATSRFAAVRWLAPVAGLLAAMGLHSAWNTSAAADVSAFFGVYVALMVPVFVAIIVTVVIARVRERRMVTRLLSADGVGGLLTPDDIALLGSGRRRRVARRAARRAGGRRAARRVRAFQEAATAVAFHRDRAARGLLRRDATAAAREAELIQTLASLVHEVRGLAPAPQPPPTPGGGPVFVRG